MIKSIRLVEEELGNLGTENSNHQSNLPTSDNKLYFSNNIPDNIKPYIYSVHKELIQLGYELNQSYSFIQVKSLLIDLSRKKKPFDSFLLLNIYNYYKISVDEPVNLMEILICIFSSYIKIKQSREKLSRDCQNYSNRCNLINNKLLKLKLEAKHHSNPKDNKSSVYFEMTSINGFDKENELYYFIVKHFDNSTLLEWEINSNQLGKRNKIPLSIDPKKPLKIIIWKFDQVIQRLIVLHDEIFELINHQADKPFKKYIQLKNNLSLEIEIHYIDSKLSRYQLELTELTLLKDQIYSEMKSLDNDLRTIEELKFDKEIPYPSNIGFETLSTQDSLSDSISCRESISDYLVRKNDRYHDYFEKTLFTINKILLLFSIIISIGRFDIITLILTVLILGVEYNYISIFYLNRILVFSIFSLVNDIIFFLMTYQVTNISNGTLSNFRIFLQVLSLITIFLKIVSSAILARLCVLYQYKKNNLLIDESFYMNRTNKEYDFKKVLETEVKFPAF